MTSSDNHADPQKTKAEELAKEAAEDIGKAMQSEIAANDTPKESEDPSATPNNNQDAEIAELKDRLMRSMAEIDNTRKRAQRDVQDASKYATKKFAEDMISVLDNLHRATENLTEEVIKDDELLRNLLEGVELTKREMITALEKHGVKRIDPVGKAFDYNFHEAMVEIPDVDQPAGTVVQVIQAGYTLHDRLLRAAKVAVAKGG